MVRRALLTAALAGLVAAGAATATLLSLPPAILAATSTGSGCTSATPSTSAEGGVTTAPATTATATTVGLTVPTATAATTVRSAVASVTTATAPTTTAPASTTTPPASTTAPVVTTTAQTVSVGTTTSSTTATVTSTSPCATTVPTAPSVTAVPVVASDSSSTLVLTGHGFGHGMGMAQWGAYGYALHGWTANEILLHYYQGTTLGPDAAPTVRVLLAAGSARTTLVSASPWRVTDSRGTTLSLPAGAIVVPATLRVHGRSLVSPLTFIPGTTPIELGGRPYRGRMIVVSNGSMLQIVNAVSMVGYLDGVVGSEMPSTWPAAALEAQAIAARSYVLAQIEDIVTASPFDVYSDTRSQVYGGIDAETPSVLAAVKATQGEVVLYDGQVATTYYSASSGGETVSAAEATGTAVPYLQSVPDPYDVLSPFHDWGPVLIGSATAGKALGLAGPLVGLDTVPGPSHHVATATAVAATGQLTLTGSQVEADLGLRSTWFDVGWLSLVPPPAPVAAGTKVALQGVVRGVTDVVLQGEPAGGTWQQLATIVPGAGGSFTATVTPLTTTRYRLAAGNIRAALITVRVAG